MPTYYETLEVGADATFSEIKSAYRKKAMNCHPDRGGSHVEMVMVNEAWEVLSDSKSRKQYDQLLATGASMDGKFAAARSRATNYPKTWAKFDQWFNAIGKDFTDAEYGKTDFLGMGVPTGGNSVSGWLFIVAGGILGAVTAGVIYYMWTPEPTTSRFGFGSIKSQHPLRNPLALRFGFVGLVAIGAWVGKFLHRAFGSFIALWLREATAWWPADTLASISRSPTQQSTPDSVKSRHDKTERCECPQCGQKLKLPALTRNAVVTCPKCSKKFDLSPETSNKPNEFHSMQFPPNKTTLTSIFKGLLIADIALLVLLVPLVFIDDAVCTERGYVLEPTDADTFLMGIYAVMFVVIFPALVACWVGLFKFKNWSRWIYLAIVVGVRLVEVPLGCLSFSLMWNLTAAILDFNGPIAGAVVAVTFLSPLATEFQKGQDKSIE